MENQTQYGKIETLGGWQMFNDNNETNATEAEIILFLNEAKGKSGIEREEMLNTFCKKYKARVISKCF